MGFVKGYTKNKNVKMKGREMNKKLICGMASLVLAAMPTVSTFAVGTGTQSHDVTVGEADETIYSVDISWGDMIFDWKYNHEKNEFDFKAHWSCVGGLHWNAAYSGYYYTDDACTTKYTDNISGTPGLYIRNFSSGIGVDDNSVNGRIVASVAFTPTDKYSWVIGKFTDSDSVTVDRDTETITYGEDIVGGIMPRYTHIAPGYHYRATFYLEKDSGATVTAESVTASDKIGTITLSISPDTTPITD